MAYGLEITETMIKAFKPKKESHPMGGKLQPTRFKLALEYEGTRYSGWQKQDDAKTIQGTLLRVASEVFDGAACDIQGNGRTDAGVHALYYTAHLEVATKLSPPLILRQFNDLLPQDIVILGVEKASAQFHARHHCLARSYLYQVAKRKTAFGKRHVWWVQDKLDFAAMEHAAELLVGMHDFISFAEKQELKKSTLVLLKAAILEETEDLIHIRFVASHFLWKMVRRLVGILVEIGRHRFTAQDLAHLLKERSDLPARYTAPPAGLFFEKAFYDEKELQQFLKREKE